MVRASSLRVRLIGACRPSPGKCTARQRGKGGGFAGRRRQCAYPRAAPRESRLSLGFYDEEITRLGPHTRQRYVELRADCASRKPSPSPICISIPRRHTFITRPRRAIRQNSLGKVPPLADTRFQGARSRTPSSRPRCFFQRLRPSRWLRARILILLLRDSAGG